MPWYLILILQHSQVLVQQHILIKVQVVPYSIAPSTKTDQLFLLGVQMIHPLTIVRKYWITLSTTAYGRNVCIAYTRYCLLFSKNHIKVIRIISLDCLWALCYSFFVFLRKLIMVRYDFLHFHFCNVALGIEKAHSFFISLK